MLIGKSAYTLYLDETDYTGGKDVFKFKVGDIVECIEGLDEVIRCGEKFIIEGMEREFNANFVNVTSIRSRHFFKGVYERRFKLLYNPIIDGEE